MSYPLILRRDAGGNRHYLDGEPVTCGTALELQVVRYQYTDATGERRVPVDRWVKVRYEASLAGRAPEDVRITLYANIGGHTAVIQYSDSLRFRWPER